MRRRSQLIGWLLGCVLTAFGGFIFSCSSSMTDNPVAQNDLPGIAFAARSVDSLGDPLDPIEFSPGGDLYTVVPATPSGTLRNLTADLTNGEGDVSDPEVFPQTDEDQFRKVVETRIISTTMDHAPLEQALASRIKMWKFPHLYDGIIIVTYPFVFSPV